MEGARANLYFALCFITVTSTPNVNAFPMTSYYQTAFFQQSSAINAITEAITVSHLQSISYKSQFIFLHHRMQLKRQLLMHNKISKQT